MKVILCGKGISTQVSLNRILIALIEFFIFYYRFFLHIPSSNANHPLIPLQCLMFNLVGPMKSLYGSMEKTRGAFIILGRVVSSDVNIIRDFFRVFRNINQIYL